MSAAARWSGAFSATPSPPPALVAEDSCFAHMGMMAQDDPWTMETTVDAARSRRAEASVSHAVGLRAHIARSWEGGLRCPSAHRACAGIANGCRQLHAGIRRHQDPHRVSGYAYRHNGSIGVAMMLLRSII